MALGAKFDLGHFQGLDNEGKPVPYGKLYFTDSFTGEVILSYKNSGLTTVNTNPVILSASGKADVYLAGEQYDIVLKDANGQVIWSIDDFIPAGLDINTSAWRELHVATEAQRHFIFENPVITGSTIIYKNGLLQEEGESQDYTITPSYTVVFTEPATHNDEIVGFGATPTVSSSVLYSNGSVPMDDTYTPTRDTDLVFKKYVDDRMQPAGSSLEFYGTTAPKYYFPCDGRSLAEEDYPELFAAIGNIYDTFNGVESPGDGHFRIPPQEDADGYGLFSRGSGKSPVGSFQYDTNKEHDHTLGRTVGGQVAVERNAGNPVSINAANTSNTGVAGGQETRPRNITVLRCICAGREII